jgi:hypothetical protein
MHVRVLSSFISRIEARVAARHEAAGAVNATHGAEAFKRKPRWLSKRNNR